MKLKKLILFIFLSVLSSNLVLAHRLVYEDRDDSSNTATGVYLNEVTGKVIVQKYKFEDSGIKASDYSFPSEVKSFANFYHPLSRLRPDISQEKVSIDLQQTSPQIQVELEKAMDLSRDRGNKLIQSINIDLFKQASNKVISNESKGSQKSFAIFSDKRGKITLARGRNSKLSLPEVASFPGDILNSLDSKRTKEIDVSTPLSIEATLSSMDTLTKSYDFSESQVKELTDAINKKRAILDHKINNMELVKSITKNGEEIDVFFDFEDGSFFLRTKRDGRVIDDEFFHVTDDANLDDLKRNLERKGLFSEEEFVDSFENYNIQSCEGLESIGRLLPDLDMNISNILKVNNRLWGSYLENAISDKPILLEDGSMVVAISALNEVHNVKIELSSLGEISNVKFLNKNKSLDDGVSIKVISENGKKYFKIVAQDPVSGEEIDQFFFDSEVSADGKKTLAVYTRGNGSAKELYDKNIFKLTLSGNKVTKSDKKIQLSSERADTYPRTISKGSEQGVKSFFFKNFFSLESRRDKLTDEIRSAVDDQMSSINKDGNIYVDKSEVNQIVLNIVRDVEKDLPKLKTNVGKLTAKTYEHAYKNFVSTIVPKMVKDLVPGEAESFYTNITDASMRSLNECLERASAKSNEKAASQCLDVYINEAPVKIGEEVLKFQLKQNDQAVLSDTAVSEYLQCIKENYDATLDMSYVKGCVYKAMLKAVDKDMEKVVGVSLSAMEEDYKRDGKSVSLSVERETLKQARNDLRSCYESKGYFSPTLFKDNYDQGKLNSLGTDDFKNDLLGCSSRIEQAVGRSVSGLLVEYELDAMSITGSEKERIKNATISNGYDNCINIQNGIVDRLAREGEFRKAEAAKCTALVTLTATDLVISNTLKEKLGDQLWSDLLVSDKPPHLKCFEDLKSSARNELFATKAAPIDFEKESASCLKQSVVWASYHLGQKELASVFSSDPLYRNVNLNAEKQNYYAEMIQSCFKDEMETLSTVTEVSGALDNIQSKCTVNLVLSDSASNDILAPIVSGMLEDSDVDKEIINKTRGEIVKRMRANVKEALNKKEMSLDEVVLEFKEIQGEATYLVADATVDKYVYDMIPGPGASDISKSLRTKLFEGKLNFKSRLLAAKDKSEIDSLVTSMTEAAAADLTEHATRVEGEVLLEKGLLKTNRDVENMAQSGRTYMESCLAQRPKNRVLSDYLDTCVEKVKASVTYDVFSSQLRDILYSGPYSEAFSPKERDEVFKRFVNDELKTGIKKAYASDDLSGLQTKFTLDATSTIGEKVLSKSIEDVYLSGIDSNSSAYKEKQEQARVVSSVANNELQSCLDYVRRNGSSSTDACVDGARFKATSLIFDSKVRPILNLLSKDENVQDKFMNKSLEDLKNCSQRISRDVNDYSVAVNGCLVESIFDLVESLVTKASESTELLQNIKGEDLSKFRSCIEDQKIKLVRSSVELKSRESIRKSLYSKVSERESFWVEYFSEQPGEDSQRKIDWAIEVVQKCGLSEAAPAVVRSIGNSDQLGKFLNLSSDEEEFTKDIISRVEGFAIDTLKDGLWIKTDSDKETISEESNDSKSVELDSISNYLNKYLPMVGEYIKKLHSYSADEMKLALDKLLSEVKEVIKEKGELSVAELKKLLMSSDLINIIIESEVSEFIKKEAKDPLSKEGVSEETISRLGSKEIIGPIFQTPEGRKAIADIKEQFIEPMLDGNGPKEIPAAVVKDVKYLLAKDTRMGGFVETLAGGIVQNTLEDKRPKNFASSGIASLLGYDPKDFLWEDLRLRREKGVSSAEQPVSKAMEYFGDQVLLPILLNEDLGKRSESGIFRSKEVDLMEERKEKFAKMVEGIMDL